MDAIFKPAIWFANQLRFSQKFLVIFVVFLVPLIYAIWIIYDDASLSIKQMENALAGQELILTLKPIAIIISKHRGMSSQYFNGETDKKKAILALETELKSTLKIYHRQMIETSEFPTNGLTIKSLQNQWKALELKRAPQGPVMNFQLHTFVISGVLSLIRRVANRSGLVLDTELSSFYLTNSTTFIIPVLQETLGQLRDKAAGAVANANLTSTTRIGISALLASVKQANLSLQNDLKLLLRDPNIKEHIAAEAVALKISMKKFTDAIAYDVLQQAKLEITSDMVFQFGSDTISKIAALNLNSINLLSEINDVRIAEKRELRDQILWLSTLALLLCCYLGFGISASIRISIMSMKETAQELSNGNFKVLFNVKTRDMLSEMSSSLNSVVDRVSELIRDMQTATDDVGTTSHQLQYSSDISRKEVEKQLDETQLIATSATEMAATVREVALNCNQASDTTQNAYEAVATGTRVISDTITAINALAEDVTHASNTIEDLEREVANISKVVDVISGIAEQTNLLALNAAIEAARAGEQGRGFAVVADEVRLLASRTQQSTTDIQAMIVSLQRGSKKAVAATYAGKSRAETTVEGINAAGKSLDSINVEIQRLVDLNLLIATATEQQSVVAEEISENTNRLSAAAEEVMTQVKETTNASNTLMSRAEHLNEASSQFKIN